MDLYALLGVPLRLTLGYPAAATADPLADPELSVGAGRWHDGFTPQTQADWAATFAALALCKPFVQAVQWVHLSDAQPHQFPHAGLLDADNQPRPAFDRLRQCAPSTCAEQPARSGSKRLPSLDAAAGWCVPLPGVTP